MKMTAARMWQVVSAKDGNFDGQFVYGVKTTGIFCRPTCPSKRPKPDNVLFFDTPLQAEAQGFRACLRCRPKATESATAALVEKIEKHIAENLDRTLTLRELSQFAGLSASHLQRIFKAERGLSPSQYARECRLEKLKGNLSKMDSVTEALYDAGYSSSSRLYEKGKSALGMTPGSYKKGGRGLKIAYTAFLSPLGEGLLAATEDGLCFLQFGKAKELAQALKVEFPQATLLKDQEALKTWTEALNAYFKGERTALDLPVHLSGTDFQKKVWRYLQTIPAGETRSYTEVARDISAPQAVRAVAQACATNKVAIAIPCHRVLKQDGGLAGFRWGLERKKALLERERIIRQAGPEI
jgi:AraC family transcriptional regulator, regulatory protein of adaptative response / methylated-DNA-[protein]-cysteine methyltransferase